MLPSAECLGIFALSLLPVGSFVTGDPPGVWEGKAPAPREGPPGVCARFPGLYTRVPLVPPPPCGGPGSPVEACPRVPGTMGVGCCLQDPRGPLVQAICIGMWLTPGLMILVPPRGNCHTLLLVQVAGWSHNPPHREWFPEEDEVGMGGSWGLGGKVLPALPQDWGCVAARGHQRSCGCWVGGSPSPSSCSFVPSNR